MAPVACPARGRRMDLRVFDVYVCALLIRNSIIDRCPLTLLVESCARVIKSGGIALISAPFCKTIGRRRLMCIQAYTTRC